MEVSERECGQQEDISVHFWSSLDDIFLFSATVHKGIKS